MRIYILGICGTFMSGIAQLAKEKGYEVSGCDENIYPCLLYTSDAADDP